MEAKLQRRVQRYGWDAAAATYEDSWRDHLAPAHSVLFELADLKLGETVLDVACGSGLTTIPAAQRVGPYGRVIATDISDEMVSLVQQAAHATKLQRVTAAQMDAEKLDLVENQFDAVICALGLMYVPEPQTALREMHRVLSVGGRAVAAVWGERRNCGWADLFPVVDSVVQSDVCPLFFRLGTAHVLTEELTTAGFARVEERRINVITKIATAEQLHKTFFDSGPVALATKRFTPALRQHVESFFFSSVRQFQAIDGSFKIPGEFVIVKGVKE